jgi:hypothetical protein
MIDYILKDHHYVCQKSVTNPDGTMNYGNGRHKEYGHFNRCFTSSSTMSYNQVLDRLFDKGLFPNSSKPIYFDEKAYHATLMSKINGGDAWKENTRRYFWEEHQDLLTIITQGAFLEQVPGDWVYYKHAGNYQNIVKVLKSNYQPLVGINISKYYRGGAGHVTTAVGWREDKKGNVLGIFFNDPAGNLIKKGSYRESSETEGIEVFYPMEVLKNILGGGHIMYFREKSN